MFNITVQHKKQTHYWHHRIVLVRIRRQTFSTRIGSRNCQYKYLKTPPKNCEKTLENRHERFLTFISTLHKKYIILSINKNAILFIKDKIM